MKDILIYLFIVVIFSFLSFLYKELLLLIPSLFGIYRIFKISKKYLIICLLLTLAFFLNYNLRINIPKVIGNEFKVVKVNKFNYFIENKNAKVLLKTDKKLNIDDKIKLEGKYKRVESIDNFNLFNYKNYLMSQNIYYEIFTNKIKVLKASKQSNASKSKIDSYFQYLFFMDKYDIDDNIIKILIELSILHLVVISGFHFNIFFSMLNKLTFFIKNNKVRNTIVFIILFLYLKALIFAYPALRAFLNLFIKELEIKSLTPLNRYGLIGLIIMFTLPFSCLSFSFILTMYTSFWILILPKEIKENKLYFSFTLMLINIPLIASINSQVSLLSFLYTVILTPIILLVYFIVFTTYYIEPLSDYGSNFLDICEKGLVELNKYNLILETGYLSIVFCIVFLIIILFCLLRKRRQILYLLIPLTLVIVYSNVPPLIGTITFLNVGQGDCIIIRPPLSNKAMMIDVAKPFKQNTVNSIIIPYLKAERIKEIEKLVITHSDIDHSGGKEDLIKNFKVKEVIDKKQKIIKFNEYTFIDILYKSKFKDKNSNSITLYSRINGLNYFFAGDMSKESENELKRYVSKMPVDILKVAHHGSKTSTSQELLSLTNPKYAIVSSKKNNSYNHPHPEVVQRLNENKVKIYNTADEGTIRIKYNYFFNFIDIFNKWKN